MSKLKNKVVFLTGGTGSFGGAFVPMTLKNLKPKKLIYIQKNAVTVNSVIGQKNVKKYG